MGLGSILGTIGKGILGLVPGGGTINTILDVAGKAAPILGGMAGARSAAKAKAGDQQRDLGTFNMQAPRYRLGTAGRAALGSAGPVTANWGGPGSGLRGQKVSFSGGASRVAANPELKRLSDEVMMRELQAQLAGDKTLPEPNFFDNLLGGAAAGTSLLGAFRGAGGSGKVGNEPIDRYQTRLY